MSNANDAAAPADDWSVPSGDLIVPSGDVLGVKFLREQIGGPFTAFLVDLPTGIRPYFKLVDVCVGQGSVTQPPFSVDPAYLRVGQWIELGCDVTDHVLLAVMCVGRPRVGSRDAGHRRFRGVLWLRGGDGRLWSEAVGWVGQEAADSFAAWCSR